jgi:hypothetical protein
MSIDQIRDAVANHACETPDVPLILTIVRCSKASNVAKLRDLPMGKNPKVFSYSSIGSDCLMVHRTQIRNGSRTETRSSRSSPCFPPDYTQWLEALKLRISGARQRAFLAVNQEQIRLYHDIGQQILDRRGRQGWGARVIDRLSADLRSEFPEMKGLSASNLKYMRFFA